MRRTGVLEGHPAAVRVASRKRGLRERSFASAAQSGPALATRFWKIPRASSGDPAQRGEAWGEAQSEVRSPIPATAITRGHRGHQTRKTWETQGR